MAVYRRGNVYWVRIWRDGRQIRKSAGKGASKADAKALEAEMFREFMKHLPGLRKHTLQDAYDRWLATDCRALKSFKKTGNHALHALEGFWDEPLTQAPKVVDAIKTRMLGLGLSNATVNRRIAVVIRLCNLAFKWGWLDQPIASKITKLPEHNERHVYLEPEQVEALASACYLPEAGDLIRVAAFTGLRRGELLSLSANMLQGDVILLPAYKSRRRAVPVPEHIRPIVQRMPLPVTDGQLRLNWDHARKITGMAQFRFHDLRHSYASWLVQSGASLRAVQELLGHTTPTVTQRYAHLEVGNLRTVVTQMVAVRGKPTT